MSSRKTVINSDYSVVLPVYSGDSPEYVQEAVQSIFAQSLKPSEVVIIVDGLISSIVREYLLGLQKRNKILKLILLPRNFGRGVARRIGILHCKSDIIGLMDADDISLPNRFEEQIGMILENDLDFVGGQVAEFDNSCSNIKFLRQVPLKHADILQFARYRQPVNNVSLVFKKSAYLSTGGYSNLRYFEDFDLIYRALGAGLKFGNSEKVVALVRFDPTRRKFSLGYLKEEVFVLKKAWQLGILRQSDFFVGIVLRIGLRLMPAPIIRFFYRSVLRVRPKGSISTVN